MLVHSRGDWGSPRVEASNRACKSWSRVRSCSVTRRRPPPQRRTRCAVGDSASSARGAPPCTSASPARMVGRESPVASATAVMPPHPMARASQAAQRRRTCSSMTGLRAWYLFRIVAMISASDIKHRRVPCPKSRASKRTCIDAHGESVSNYSSQIFPGKTRDSLAKDRTTVA